MNQVNKKSQGPLYLALYEYYKELIMQGSLKPGEKLPSIRRCALERQVSKTTVEASYMQLAAEGYVHAVGGSGYYVSEIEFAKVDTTKQAFVGEIINEEKIIYDFVSSTVDDKSFDFDLWRRYMKSALRNTERLLAYGDTQGEADLRIALRNYVNEARGVVCSEEQIIIGAGAQSLLNILCALTGERNRICFTGNGFKQGKAVFEDRGFQSFYQRKVEDSMSYFKEKQIDMIYVSPSHMTPWGQVMPMKTRVSLLDHAAKEDCLIIEDDFDSEFRYYMRPVPSLQSLDGGRRVVYLGSFSRLLLPSLRIAFMVLPSWLLPIYKSKGYLYNQTASTAEQIALCQFIRDGHLKKQIKKARKLYMNKSQQLCSAISNVFGEKAKAIPGSAGFLVRMEVNTEYAAEELVEAAKRVGVALKVADQIEDHQKPCILLSCSSIDESEFEKAMVLLKEKWMSCGYL